jgi:hypothetical protein
LIWKSNISKIYPLKGLFFPSFILFSRVEGDFLMSAYSSSYTHDTSQETGGVFHALGEKVRGCLTRNSKPIDHLGGLNPDQRIPARVDNVRFNAPLYDPDRDINTWPKSGTTHKDMEICIG